jgi:hypothetical protein
MKRLVRLFNILWISAMLLYLLWLVGLLAVDVVERIVGRVLDNRLFNLRWDVAAAHRRLDRLGDEVVDLERFTGSKAKPPPPVEEDDDAELD